MSNINGTGEWRIVRDSAWFWSYHVIDPQGSLVGIRCAMWAAKWALRRAKAKAARIEPLDAWWDLPTLYSEPAEENGADGG